MREMITASSSASTYWVKIYVSGPIEKAKDTLAAPTLLIYEIRREAK